MTSPVGWVPILAAAVVVVLAALAIVTPADSGRAEGTVRFIRGTVTGSGFTTFNPTAITFGPDGRLYVADREGRIQALDLDPISKAVIGVEEVASDDDLQEVFGIAFDPNETASPPPVYVTNTVSERGRDGKSPAGSHPGKVTKIHGPAYTIMTDIITGLSIGPGHQSNGLGFAADGTLYIAQGSTTNAGLPGVPFSRREVPLSGALLEAAPSVPGFDGNLTFDPPNTYSDTVDQVSGDVRVYAAGFRNPYDFVIHTNGHIYATDNGPNAGQGPASTGCDSHVENPWNPDERGPDELNIVIDGNYYGHPNRNRGRFDPRQCIYHSGTEGDGPDWTGPIALLPTSSNGLVEYTAGTFGGQLRGDLFYVSFVDNSVGRIVLSPDGTAVASHLLFDSGYTAPLDITMGPDGTLYIAEFATFRTSRITFLKPDESGLVPGVLNANATVDSGEDREPQVKTDGAGNWVAVWGSEDDLGGTIGVDADILVARSTDSGATWTAPVALNTNAANDLGLDDIVELTMDDAGNWLAVWRSDDDLNNTIGQDTDVLVARSTDNGATWTAPVALNTNAATDVGEDGFPMVATDSAGNWVAVWDSRDDLGGTIAPDWDILVARSTDNGATWTDPVALNANAAIDEGRDREPRLATDSAGNWVVVWDSVDDLEGTIGSDFDNLVARSTDNGATWTDPVALNTNAATDSSDERRPRVTTDGLGNWLTVWGSHTRQDDTPILDIRVARSTDNGTTWTSPVVLDSRANEASKPWQNHTHQQVATDGDGNWVAIWDTRDNAPFDGCTPLRCGGFELRVALSTNNGASWTASSVFADTAGGWPAHPQVTIDGAGTWLTVWESGNDLEHRIGSDLDILYRTDILGVFDLLDAPKPTPTSTPTVLPTPPANRGDADCNGRTTSVDAAFVLQFGAGLLSELPCAAAADANDDGDVTSLDAALILQLVAGLLTGLPP